MTVRQIPDGTTVEEAIRLARMGDATEHEPEPLPDPPEWHRDEEGDHGDR